MRRVKYLLKYISHGLFQKELLPVQVVSGIFNSGQKCPSRMHAPSRTPLLLPLLLSHNLPTPFPAKSDVVLDELLKPIENPDPVLNKQFQEIIGQLNQSTFYCSYRNKI